MNVKRYLRNLEFVERRLLRQSSHWVDMMPQKPRDYITGDPIYQKLRDTYLTKGPRLWVYLAVYRLAPITSQELYAAYLADAAAVEQRFFNSLSHLKHTHLHHYLRDGSLRVSPFNRRIEAFKGFELDLKRAFERIDPHIVLELRPVPQTTIAQRYLALAAAHQEAAGLPSSPPEIVIS